MNLRFPVAVPFLMNIEHSDPDTNTNPEAIAIPEWSIDYKQRGRIIDAYNKEALNRLEAMPPSGFARNLEALDVLIRSLELE